MSTFLPADPSEISDSWIRNVMKRRGANFILYYLDELDGKKRREMTGVFKSIPYKVFMANHDRSKTLIEESSLPDRPSLLLTHDRNLGQYFQKSPAVNVVPLAGRPLEEVSRDLSENILLMFGHVRGQQNGLATTSSSHDISNRYCTRKIFLEPVSLTENLLTRANELLLSLIRGALPEYSKRAADSRPLSSRACYNQNIRLLWRIEGERMADYLLGAVERDFDNAENAFSTKLIEKGRRFLRNLDSDDARDSAKGYEDLVSETTKFLQARGASASCILLLPSLNPLAKQLCLAELDSDSLNHSQLAKVHEVLDLMFEGGREAATVIMDDDEEEVVRDIAEARIRENSFLTAWVASAASHRVVPVLKTETASQKLYSDVVQVCRFLEDSRTLLHGGGSSNLRQAYIEECKEFHNRYRRMRERFSKHIPATYSEFLVEYPPRNLRIFSSLPIELADITGYELCLEFPYTRIPILPMASLMAIRDRFRLDSPHEVKLDGYGDILFLRGLASWDPLWDEYGNFEETCKNQGFNLEFQDAASAEHFLETVNDINPTILGYYGHAGYDRNRDETYLSIQTSERGRYSRLYASDLSSLREVPTINVLLGCETSSCEALVGSLTMDLLARGSLAVLGTTFPVSAEAAGLFFGRLLNILADPVYREHYGNFDMATAVFTARQLGFLQDRLYHLQKLGFVDDTKRALTLKRVGESFGYKRGKLGKVMSESMPTLGNIVSEMNLAEPWEEYGDLAVPYSVFLTLLGNASEVVLTMD
jgi:hypothetical protein